MSDEEEPVLKTIQEAKMAIKILAQLNQKREKLGKDYAWLYISEAMRELKGFKAMTIRSFIAKLQKRKVIEFIPPQDWGGAFRYTARGEQRIKEELAKLSVVL